MRHFTRVISISLLLDAEDEAGRMALSRTYLAWEQTTEQRGEQRGQLAEKRNVIEALLKARFGEQDEAMLAIAPQLLRLSTDDDTRLILQSSREELVALFSPGGT